MRRHRFRFKLATLLIAVAVVALALAVILSLWNRPPAVDPFDATEMIGADKMPTKQDRVVPQAGHPQDTDLGTEKPIAPLVRPNR